MYSVSSSSNWNRSIKEENMNRVLERVLKVILWSALSLVVLAASLIVFE